MFTPQPEPRLDVRWEAGSVVVRILNCNSLTEFNLEPVAAHLNWLVEGQQRQELVLDLCNIDFLSSSALGLFLNLHRKLSATDGRLILVSTEPAILKIFAITGLESLIEIRPDLPLRLRPDHPI